MKLFIFQEKYFLTHAKAHVKLTITRLRDYQYQLKPVKQTLNKMEEKVICKWCGQLVPFVKFLIYWDNHTSYEICCPCYLRLFFYVADDWPGHDREPYITKPSWWVDVELNR